MIIVMAVFTILFVVIEIPNLSSKKRWKELALAGGILLVAVMYGLDLSVGQNILPNPNLLLHSLIPLTEAFRDFFNLAQ